MPTFETKRHVPFTAEQMFAVVADIGQYPKFLPLCTGLSILTRETAPDGEVLTARMSVGYKSIAESFTTRVALLPAQNRIDVSYLDGPFKRLDNRWLFVADPTGSVIDFYISYEFRSMMLGALVGGMFDTAFRKFAHAFEDRAGVVYGRPSSLA